MHLFEYLQFPDILCLQLPFLGVLYCQ